MARLSDRISSALSSIRCPGCGKFVVPTYATGAESPPATATEGKRWSFAWRPPRGLFCPECQFPLSRYQKRVKWVRLFLAGVVFLTLALLLWMVDLFGSGGGVPPWVLPSALGIGGVTFVVGLIGLIVGGRHTAD